MSIQSQLIMIAWIPIVFYLFLRFKTQEAVIISFIVAWLFLPQEAGFIFPGLPDYERISATVYGILLATIVYDIQRISKFDYSWLDLPMAIWCICPIFTSLSNGLGIYDGISESLTQTVAYGGPYFLGRIYLNNLAGLRKLAIGIFLSGLVYVPLCLYEIRMSPQLHQIVYGYHGNQSFNQTIRYGGFRPTVFMRHGLSVGMWMMAATLIGICLWRTGVIKQIYGFHIRWFVGILLVTFILLKSTGAYGLLLLGLIFLFLAWYFRTSIAFLLLIVAMVFYLQQSVSANTYITDSIITTVSRVIPDPERIHSLQFRFDNEEILGNKARERMIFGWGGWGRNRVYEYDWKGDLVDISITDSLWIIAFGKHGLVGLVSVFGSILIPVLYFCLRCFPAGTWSHQKVAPAAVLTIITVLYMLDCLLNNQFNPIFTLANGGITGLVVSRTRMK